MNSIEITLCAVGGSLVTMGFRWRDGCVGRVGSECTKIVRESCSSFTYIKVLRFARPSELRRRPDKVMRFYIKEFHNPWHCFTLTLFLN